MMLGEYPMSDCVIKKETTLRKEGYDLIAKLKKKKKGDNSYQELIGWRVVIIILNIFILMLKKYQDFTILTEIYS